MAAKPVAYLVLDTRSYGPALCPRCGELENVVLASDGTIRCPICNKKVPGFEDFSRLIVRAEKLV